MTTEQQWWYSFDGSKKGPCTVSDIKELIMSRDIGSSDLVWNKGLTDWVALESVQEFSDALEASDEGDIEPPPLPPATSNQQPATSNQQPATSNQQIIATTNNPAQAETSTEHQRVYFAPRLDAAFDAQAKIAKHGKSTVIIITVLSFAGGALGLFGIIGLIAYWATFYKNKGKIEEIEKELYSKNKEDGLVHDISEMRNMWLRFGPAISYALSIFTVCLLIAKWFIKWLWNASNANN